MNTIYQQVGALLQEDGRCSFRVWAPLANKVTLSLDVADMRSYAMERGEYGYWETIVERIVPGTKYFYVLDDGNPLPDPASRHQPEGVHGPSAVVDPYFSWTDQAWQGLELSEMIIYELHTGTFTGLGTFEGIQSRLDYLWQLGVNTIEIMPVGQFPGTRNWGYDGVFPYAVQDSYGGVSQLKALVNAAHARGMAVILDVVYNHLGPEGNYLAEYGPYFTDKYKTPWGQAINLDDAYSDPVRAYFLQHALLWLDEFHIDGLRVDAVHALWDNSATHFVELLSESVKALEKRTGKKKVLIAELDLNNPRYVRPVTEGGYGMSGQWVDEFHHALHALLTGERKGYYEDFGDISLLEHSLQHVYVYTGQYSLHRQRCFGQAPTGLPYSQFVVFTQNHDQIGNRLKGERLSVLLSYEALKVAAAAMLLSPFVPLLFMGEEYGERAPFQFFSDYGEESLIAGVREGRRKEFAAFNWEGEIPDPQSEEVFNQSKLTWETHDGLLGYYQFLLAFRKSRPAMQDRTSEGTVVYPGSGQPVLAFERKGNGDRLLILLNFDKAPQEYRLPLSTATWIKLIDSTATSWKVIDGVAPERLQSAAAITLPPLSAIVYEKYDDV
ncbi:malto-oligosyltrehalose trehalohydrolase [Chitinophaga pendula]|uniref:malto-oligosyltrehalose trehalohydrolase n=1 Tax=Chitinophaga TaxID=79328 RepID=UPI000BAF0312|nr:MULTISPECIES: malto-oligosyltrehalose trehalohydrolase [Chitinophaga]ASZ15059.1 malto-oligosyltrehalose trehalohydrolase [Chitinophaga sp. MD30]UCJ08910.1 malto-oligosyltrehalose trehalohydrolase [Chitinophaga pendula]